MNDQNTMGATFVVTTNPGGGLPFEVRDFRGRLVAAFDSPFRASEFLDWSVSRTRRELNLGPGDIRGVDKDGREVVYRPGNIFDPTTWGEYTGVTCPEDMAIANENAGRLPPELSVASHIISVNNGLNVEQDPLESTDPYSPSVVPDTQLEFDFMKDM